MKTTKHLFNFCFILSGLAGLIYEMLWTRYLGLFIGNSTFANAVVLSSFMGGLALGNFIFGKIADSRKDQLRLYGIIELSIGTFAICTPAIFAVSRDLFFFVASDFIPGSGMALLLKIAFSLPLVIIPSTLMGGTLPIMVKFFATSAEVRQKSISVLYALNSFGAVAGSLLSAFVFIPSFGLEISLYIAAATNGFCALTAFFLHYSCKKTFTEEVPTILPRFVLKKTAKKMAEAPLMWAAFFAGVTGMFYEIAWFRFFSLAIGSTTYSFALMLAAFISGITIGSMALSLFKSTSKKQQIEILIICQLGIGLIMVSSLWWYERIPLFFGLLKTYFSTITPIADSFVAFEVAKYGFCFFIMFIPTLLFGIFLPLATSIVSVGSENLGKSVGKIFAYNTLGAVFGGAIGGFVMLPLFGLQNTFAITAIINCVNGIMLWWTLPRLRTMKLRRVAISLAGIVVLLWSAFAVPPWTYAILSSGIFRLDIPLQTTFQKFKQDLEKQTVLFAEQGPSGMVTVEKDPSNTVMSLKINGKADASDSRDMSTQLLLSQLPLMLHKGPKNVLNIGIGSGQTAGGVLLYDEVERLDLAEISNGVVRASQYFSAINHRYWHDPRTNIFVEDAKNFLALTKTKYDLILSEPTNIWISGVASLYTKEFFEQAQKKLSDDGIFAQWLHLYSMSDESVYLILRTLHQVFPHISIWELYGSSGRIYDVMYVASKKPLEPNLANMMTKFARPAIKAEFAKVGIQSIEEALGRQITGPKLTKAIAGEGEINTDIKPILEYMAPLDLFKNRRSTVLSRIRSELSQDKRDLYINSFGINRPAISN